MNIAFDRVGEGPTLVLLHGLGADRHIWDPIVPALAVRRTVVSVDLPGFGESPPLTNADPAPRALAAAVGAELARLAGGDGGPVHAAGNSLGGWVALELGLTGAVASVTAVAPAGLWTSPLMPKASLGHRLARSLLPVATAAARSPAGRQMLLTGSVAHPDRIPEADALALVRAYARAPGFVAVNDAMRAGRFTALGEIRVPVTLVWPDRDRLVSRPPEIPERIHNVELSDAGHIPIWDAPEALVTALLEGSSRGR